MNKISIKYTSVLAVALMLFVFVPMALAETNTDTSTTTATTETSEAKLKERVEEQKKKLKLSLSTVQQTQLKLRCKGAQAVAIKVHQNVGTFAPGRVKAYKNLQESLAKTITKLKEHSINTTALEQEKVILDSKIATLQTDFDAYKQYLADLKDIDCVTDPAGFKTMLESARTQHQNLITSVADIKSYITSTIKQTLKDIRQQAEDKKASSNTEGEQ